MTILVPIDDDPHRERVIDVAIDLGRGLGQSLYVVHLVGEDTADSEAKRVRDEIQTYVDDADVDATVALEYVGRRAPRPGTRVARDLLEMAEDVDISHIVMGHTEKGLLRTLTRGSVVEALLDSAPVPVTVVSEHVRRDG